MQKSCPKGHKYDSSLPSCPFCLPPKPSKPKQPSYQETQVAPELLNENRTRPVVGWLVCVQGPDVGKDFRLHTDFNRVGRAEYQDVCLSDETVSREHFTIAPLGGRVVLKKGDQIKVGNSLLVFIPLEQQDVKWDWKL